MDEIAIAWDWTINCCAAQLVFPPFWGAYARNDGSVALETGPLLEISTNLRLVMWP